MLALPSEDEVRSARALVYGPRPDYSSMTTAEIVLTMRRINDAYLVIARARPREEAEEALLLAKQRRMDEEEL